MDDLSRGFGKIAAAAGKERHHGENGKDHPLAGKLGALGKIQSLDRQSLEGPLGSILPGPLLERFQQKLHEKKRSDNDG
ncbi:MAG: hypothetical protein R3236_06195 [Phycisphaeraceae bacterium]|nr:hypothetical protein [Phycisphaeraceae bacterium]